VNDLDHLIVLAQKQGFDVRHAGSGHLKLIPRARDAPIVIVARSPYSTSTAKVRADLKRAGLVLPAASKRKSKVAQKETQAMARTNTKATIPAVSTADEARALRAQASAASTIDREVRNPANMLEPMKLDADIAHLGGDVMRPKAKLPRRREPDEVAVVYRGKYKGMLHDAHIQITVPDDENEAKVAALEEIIPGMDPQSQKAEWTQKAKMQGLEVAPPYVPLHKRLTLSGITYDFDRNEATLVHEDDLDCVLAHPTYRMERVDTLDDADEPLPTGSRRSRRLAQAQAAHGPLKRGS